MKILLTGATGFIGSSFARLAISRGHEVTGLVRSGRTLPADLKVKPLSGELESISTKELTAMRADVCVHSAWITTPGVYLESPENFQFRDDSLQFLRRVAEAGTKQIVGVGTCIEYQISKRVDAPPPHELGAANEPSHPSPRPLPIVGRGSSKSQAVQGAQGHDPASGNLLSEDRTPIAPTTTYAKCKNELRIAMEAEAKNDGFTFAWGRVFYPYGPGEHPSRLCSSIIQKLARDEKIVLKTPASTKDYIYIDDLAAALLAVVEKKFSGTINLGTGAGTTVREIARTIGRLMGKEELVGEVSPPEPDPLGDVVADANKLKSLGWEQKTSLEQGIQALLARSRQN